MSAQLFAA